MSYHSMQAIAHLLETPLENHGGLNVLARELASGLSPFYKVHVFCPALEGESPQGDLGSPGFGHFPWRAGACETEILAHLKEMIHEHRIKLLIFHGGDFAWGPSKGHVSIINRLSGCGIPCIYVTHQSTPFLAHLPSLENPTARPTLKSAVRFATSWILKLLQLNRTCYEVTVSKAEETQAKRRFPFFRKKIVQIYHSRIPSTPREDSMSVAKEKTVLSMGHFAFRKGQHVLLSAFGRIAANHPEWKLELVGSTGQGDYWRFLRRLIDLHQIHDQVELITETPHPDAYFKKASIYVQPSLAEAYGLALQEAMGFGCACIGSAVGGICDSIRDPSLLYPPGDEQALSRILERLMSDEVQIWECSQAALRDTVEFNRIHDRMIEDYRRMIEKCLEHQ